MYCEKCGNKVERGAKFCTSCGARLIGEYEKRTVGMCDVNLNEQSQPQKTKFKWWQISLIVVGIIVALLIVLGIIGALVNEPANNSNILDSDSSYYDENIPVENDNTIIPETYTVMIYIVGSDLESQGYCASMDIQEMMNSGINTEQTNVLICTGGATEWALGIPSDMTCIWQMITENGEVTFTPVWAEEAQNMGDEDTLSQFLKFGYENFESEHYALICWDHGGGPVYGFGVDELFGDQLFFNELKNAMDKSPFGEDNKLDWIGFDACLMASIEIANLFSEYADYLVASEEAEPGCGWDYSFLETLNTTSDTETITRSIIDRYAAYIKANGDKLFYPDATLSCMELSKVDDVLAAMDALFAEMEGQLYVAGGYGKLARLRGEVKSFGKAQNPDDCVDLVDLGSLAEVMSIEYPEESKLLLSAIENLIIYETSNLASTTGVSLYYPYDSETGYNVLELLESQGEISVEEMYESGTYCGYLDDYADYWIYGEPEYDYYNEIPKVIGGLQDGVPETSENELTMQLSKQQLTELAAAYYTILVENTEGSKYSPVLFKCKIEPDENGMLHVNLDQEVIVADTGSAETERYWTFREVEQRKDGVLYQSVNTALEGPLGAMSGTEPQWININLFEDKESGKLIINSMNYTGDETVRVGKQSIDPEKWDHISYWFTRYVPKYDANQKLLPFAQWEGDGSVWCYDIAFDENLNFKKKPISELEENFVVQITLVDVYGNCYASELATIRSGQDMVWDYEQITDAGNFTWKLYSDHAELLKYKGNAVVLEIPETVNGLPVTTIRGYAFSGNVIEEIILPDTVTTLYSYAFGSCSTITKVKLSEKITEIPDKAFTRCTALKEVRFPDTVKSIGKFAFEYCESLTDFLITEQITYIAPGAFAGCDILTNLSVEANNKYFTTKDGVLFTKDMAKLIACPGLYRQSYDIPEGVEEIWDFAFAYCYDEYTDFFYDETVEYGLTQISFPETLKKIGDGAFYECIRLEAIEIPDNVEYIGSLAFGTMGMSFSDIPNQVLESLKIGEHVSWIGIEAFGGYLVEQVEVSEDNQYYASENGVLMNKAKTETIDVFVEKD